MPSFVLSTNVKVNDVKAFIVEFSTFAAQILGKPESYMSVTFNYNELITFAGTFDPAFQLVITSLDNINPESNAKYSAEIFKYFKERLGIPGNRGYITFYDPGRAYLGHEGTTFATIFAK